MCNDNSNALKKTIFVHLTSDTYSSFQGSSVRTGPLGASPLSAISECDTSSQSQRDWVRVRVRTEYVLKYVIGEKVQDFHEKKSWISQKMRSSPRTVQEKKHSKQACTNRKTREVMSKRSFIFSLEISKKIENRLKQANCMVSLTSCTPQISGWVRSKYSK